MDYYNLVKYELQRLGAKRLARIKNTCYRKLSSLKAEFFITKEPVPFSSLSDFDFKPITVGEVWSKESFDCGWFKFSASGFTEISDDTVVLLDVGGEGLIYDCEGNARYGITDVTAFTGRTYVEKGKSVVPLGEICKNGEILFYVEVGNNKTPSSKDKSAKLKRAEIASENPDIVNYFYDYTTLSMRKTYSFFTSPYVLKTNRVLSKSYASYLKGDTGGALRHTHGRLSNGEASPYTAYCTGHAHLDLAYLWPIRESKRKAVRTFINQLNLIDKYPDYVFLASQPQQYAWIEENAPVLFDRIKTAVAQNRIEPQGAMWVECDANIPSGESFIRQIIYGQKYWREKFGKEASVCFLPDTFGFSGNLPQIMIKSGIKYFCTQKISWNSENRFPYKSFNWTGIDGSTVLSHFPPENSYSGEATVFANNGAFHSYDEKKVSDCYSMLFGVGDGGGGPSRGHLETISRQRFLDKIPKTVFSTLNNFFKKLEKDESKLPSHKGELYLERHQGCYTSQSLCKKYNAEAEYALHNAEFLIALLGSQNVDFGNLESVWKEILLYQFHDILAGSSISRVYEECFPRYEAILSKLNALQCSLLKELMSGEGLSALNLNGWEYFGSVLHNKKAYVVKLAPYSSAKLIPMEKSDLSVSENILENGNIKAVFDKGRLISLVHKRSGKEFCGKYLNRLSIYEDGGNAWDMKKGYYKKAPSLPSLISTKTVNEGVFSASVQNVYKFEETELTEVITLKALSQTLDVELKIRNLGRNKMLRADFYPSVYSETVTSGIQFGSINRSTLEKPAIAAAQREICAQKWLEVCDGNFGFSVLTKAKYGWRAKNGKLSLNLLRGTTHPAPDGDSGDRTAYYSIYPHEGDFRQGKVLKFAEAFNNPPVITDFALELSSPISSNRENVVLETVKTAEDGDGIIVRLYECYGKETSATLTSLYKAEKTNLVEKYEGEFSLDKPYVFSPFEILTLRLRK